MLKSGGELWEPDQCSGLDRREADRPWPNQSGSRGTLQDGERPMKHGNDVTRTIPHKVASRSKAACRSWERARGESADEGDD